VASLSRRVVTLVLTLVFPVVLAAGCADRPGAAEAVPAPSTGTPSKLAPTGVPQVQSRWRSCAAEIPAPFEPPGPGNDAMTLPRLDTSFRAVAAIVCEQKEQRRAGGGTDLVEVENRADDVAALLSALRLPDQPPEEICPANVNPAPWVFLLDERGRWIHPGIPGNGCSEPRSEVQAALDKLRRTRLATRVLAPMQSDLAAATGCDDEYADMVWTYGLDEIIQHPLGVLADDDAQVTVCVYRVAAGEQGSDKPRGELVSGGPLPAGRWPAVKRQIQAAVPVTTACATPSSRFVLLHTPHEQIDVELDGCRRLLAPSALAGDGSSSDTLRQPDRALADLLANR